MIKSMLLTINISILMLLTGCATTQQHATPRTTPSPTPTLKTYTNHANGVNAIIRNTALKSYQAKYVKAKKHKAFAQSLSGAWSWKANRTSIEHAKTSALVSCQNNNKKVEALYPCEIINVNDTWVQ